MPVLIREFAEKLELASKEELLDYFTIAQSMPGIIAANISMFIGYKFRGTAGCITAILGIMFAPFWAIIFLASLLCSFAQNSLVQGGMHGVGIAVIALITLTIRESWQNSNRNGFFYVIFTLALLTLQVFKVSPVQVILIFTTAGILYKKFFEKEECL